jgi:hypothetical protein
MILTGETEVLGRKLVTVPLSTIKLSECDFGWHKPHADCPGMQGGTATSCVRHDSAMFNAVLAKNV